MMATVSGHLRRKHWSLNVTGLQAQKKGISCGIGCTAAGSSCCKITMNDDHPAHDMTTSREAARTNRTEYWPELSVCKQSE